LTGGERRDRRVTNKYFVALATPRSVRATFVPYSQPFVALIARRGVSATKYWFGRGHGAKDAAA
jgi:hypothetical protein